VIPSELRLW